MKIRFISRNQYKIREAKELLDGSGIEIIPFEESLNELQTEDTNELVYDKVLKAFTKIGRPLIVEHTSLLIEKINNLPGGLTQIFWDKLLADKFCELFKGSKVTAKTVVAYCNGKTIEYFDGEIEGSISDLPKGKRDFQWDCVFIPKGYKETFSELGSKKNDISMRKIAFGKLIKHLAK